MVRSSKFPKAAADKLSSLSRFARELVLFCGHDVAYFVTSTTAAGECDTMHTCWSSCCPMHLLTAFGTDTPSEPVRPEPVASLWSAVSSEASKTRKLQQAACRRDGPNPQRTAAAPSFIERNDIRTIKERRLATKLTKFAQKLMDACSTGGFQVFICGVSRLKVARIKPLQFSFDTADRSVAQLLSIYSTFAQESDWKWEREHVARLMSERTAEIAHLEEKQKTTAEDEACDSEVCVHCWKGPDVVADMGALVWCEACALGAHVGCLTPALSQPPAGSWFCEVCSGGTSLKVAQEGCEKCGGDDDNSTIIMCDDCDQGYHFQCLEPPLEKLPAGCWLCPECVPNGCTDSDSDVTAEDIGLQDECTRAPHMLQNSRQALLNVAVQAVNQSALGTPMRLHHEQPKGAQVASDSASADGGIDIAVEHTAVDIPVQAHEQLVAAVRKMASAHAWTQADLAVKAGFGSTASVSNWLNSVRMNQAALDGHDRRVTEKLMGSPTPASAKRKPQTDNDKLLGATVHAAFAGWSGKWTGHVLSQATKGMFDVEFTSGDGSGTEIVRFTRQQVLKHLATPQVDKSGDSKDELNTQDNSAVGASGSDDDDIPLGRLQPSPGVQAVREPNMDSHAAQSCKACSGQHRAHICGKRTKPQSTGATQLQLPKSICSSHQLPIAVVLIEPLVTPACTTLHRPSLKRSTAAPAANTTKKKQRQSDQQLFAPAKLLRTHVVVDEAVKEVRVCACTAYNEQRCQVCKRFDLNSAEVTFEAPALPGVPRDFCIGLITAAGAGHALMVCRLVSKSTTLREHFSAPKEIQWDSNKAIVSHFNSPDEAIERLTAVGLNTTRAWLQPHHTLSTGEQFRADLARAIRDGATVDEFTSTVNREAARAACTSFSRHLRKCDFKRIVLATCHTDVEAWLKPDWTFDTASSELRLSGPEAKRSTVTMQLHLDAPVFTLDQRHCAPQVFSVRRSERSVWEMFRRHHYLDGSLNPSARCFVAVGANGDAIAFCAVLAMIHAEGHCYREHRLVVLPDYQGSGAGPRLSEAVAYLYKRKGFRYYSKTSHPRLIAQRERSPVWRFVSQSAMSNNQSFKGAFGVGSTRKGISKGLNKEFKIPDPKEKTKYSDCNTKLSDKKNGRICVTFEYVGQIGTASSMGGEEIEPATVESVVQTDARQHKRQRNAQQQSAADLTTSAKPERTSRRNVGKDVDYTESPLDAFFD